MNRKNKFFYMQMTLFVPKTGRNLRYVITIKKLKINCFKTRLPSLASVLIFNPM
uniref:Macaca fascicularis brain cDNA, clone: QflA-21193 n=1 Tax=Macaca fascicularis TaxID=9541 RepID=I7GIM9_MACFA|nr:unnamed protein product [Macaca fascicularis]